MTPTACETFPPPTLTFQFSAAPAHPVVGDQVQLSFNVIGRGGIPAYTLSGATPVFQGDTSIVTSDQLGTVSYQLTAVEAGTATLTLSVNYETSVGCVGQPIFQFVNDTSPPFSIEVVESPTTPTPTPIPSLSPTPLACAGDCDGNHQVTTDEILTLVNVALGGGSASSCTSARDSGITVDELLRAVNNAVNGCGTPSTHMVEVAPNGELRFSPPDVTIHVGDSVEWTWGNIARER